MKRLRLLLVYFAVLGAMSFPGSNTQAAAGDKAKVIGYYMDASDDYYKAASRYSRLWPPTRVGRSSMSWDRELRPSRFLQWKTLLPRRSMPWWSFRTRRRPLRSV